MICFEVNRLSSQKGLGKEHARPLVAGPTCSGEMTPVKQSRTRRAERGIEDIEADLEDHANWMGLWCAHQDQVEQEGLAWAWSAQPD